MEKEKTKTVVPHKFQEMYIIMGGNPNYRDTEDLIFNRSTCLLEDKKNENNKKSNPKIQ
tara:strand:+ start:1956 stop:2132 length:177 start_codon:yes stop_codon:yes gene_type:complete